MGAFFKKISVTLVSILLTLNIGCKSHSYVSKEPSLEKTITQKKPDYFTNLAGAYLLNNLVHESSHALAGMYYGKEIEDFTFYPSLSKSKLHPLGHVTWKEGISLSDKEEALVNIAGPVSNLILSETINYNLRNGKISKDYQSFWATTSLFSRSHLLFNSLNLGKDQGNDFKRFSEYTEIQRTFTIGAVTLYTALSAKRIAKEFKVATGKEYYPIDQISNLELIPINGGIGLIFSKHF